MDTNTLLILIAPEIVAGRQQSRASSEAKVCRG